MDEKRIVALAGQVIATGAIVELLLALRMTEITPDARDILIKTLRNAAQSPGELGNHLDLTAVSMSDTRVAAVSAMEAMLQRSLASLAKMQDDG